MARKLKKWTCITDVNRHEVQLKVDADTGKFSAEWMGREYEADSLPALKAKVKAAIIRDEHVEWHPMIRIEATTALVEKPSWSDPPNPAKIELEFSAILVSDEIKPASESAGRKVFKLEQDALVSEDDVTGVPNTQGRHVVYHQHVVVPFTRERWKTLNQLRDAIIELRRRVGEFVRDEKQLDSNAFLLLPAGDDQ